MWLSKRPRRIFYKRRQSQTAQEILDCLRDYLDNENSEPVEILCQFWRDQQAAISYQELRAIVEQGYLDEITAWLWEQDYSLLVTERLPKMWTDAMIAGSVSQPIMENALSAFTFNTQTPGVVEWIRSRGAYLVTGCTQTQKDAIALLLEDKMRNSHTVDELAKLIRPTIGLTKQQTAAARNFYDNMVKTLTEQHPRTKPETLQARALEQTAKYAERLHRQRALTIAQTEMAYAYNYGADEGIRQAQADYLIGKCIKKWCTSGDEGVCEECEKLDGMEIGMEEQFFSGNKVEYDESGLFPPLHPRCACAVEYIEVEAPNFSLQNPSHDVSMNQGMMPMHERSMAMGLRQPPSRILTDEEIETLKSEAQSIGIPTEVLAFNQGRRTGFMDADGTISVRGDVLPDLTSSIARDRMSSRAVLAHEYYGHYMSHPSEYANGDWRDEFRASYNAAMNAPNLSDEERGHLILDAYDRAKQAGEFTGYDETARRILYGIDEVHEG